MSRNRNIIFQMSGLFALLFFLLPHRGSAQCTLLGMVKDKANDMGLSYVTLTLLNADNNQIEDGSVSDSTGRFTFTQVQPGRYVCKAGFLGYSDRVSDTIIVPGSGTITLAPLVMAPDGHSLETVTITALAPIVENKIDKIVYNAANDLTAQGGVAIDVLKKVPQVSVDADGNVELQGNPNVRFLINGKPSAIFGSSLADALASIPASQIQSIEVIASPGARYDAQGTGGVINILLKEDKARGINGSINLSAGTRLENGAARMSYHKGDISFNAFVSGNAQVNSRSPSSQDRLSDDAAGGGNSRLLQEGYTDMLRKGLQAGAGMDWEPTRGNTLTATLQYNDFTSRKTSLIQQEETTRDASGQVVADQLSARNALSNVHLQTLDWSMDYKRKKAKQGSELDILYAASLGRPHMEAWQTQTSANALLPYDGNRIDNPGKDQQHNLSLDYAYPLSDKLTLEAGAKGSFQHIESHNDQSVYLPYDDRYAYAEGLSYHLNYDLSVYAAYLSTTAKLWHWLDMKAGIRAEYTNIRLAYNNTHIPSYLTWVPSILLSHEYSGKQVLKLSYSRRLERPEYEELNPFLNLSDPYNITTGNPYLKPEIANNFELGYSRSFDNGINFYVALSERINTNDVKSFTAFYPVYNVGDSAFYNVSVTDKRNIGKEYNSGFIFSGSLPVKDLNLRTNIMLIHKHIVNDMPGASALTNAFTARISLNASYTLPAGFLAEVFGNYRSGFVSIQGKQPGLFTYTLALRRQFRNNRISAGITATNIFGRYIRQETVINTTGYTATSVRELPFRSIGLTFSYRLGKMEFGKKEPQTEQHLPSEN